MPQHTQNTLSEHNNDKLLTAPILVYSPFVFNDILGYSDYRMINGKLWEAVVVA